MEQAIALAVEKLLEHGPWGFLVGWLMYTNWRLNNRLDAANGSMEAMLVRHADQREKSGEVMTAAAAASTKVSEAIAILSDRLEDNTGKLANLVNTDTALCERVARVDQALMSELQRRER